MYCSTKRANKLLIELHNQYASAKYHTIATQLNRLINILSETLQNQKPLGKAFTFETASDEIKFVTVCAIFLEFKKINEEELHCGSLSKYSDLLTVLEKL